MYILYGMMYSELNIVLYNIMYIWYGIMYSKLNIVLSRILCTSGTVCCIVS